MEEFMAKPTLTDRYLGEVVHYGPLPVTRAVITVTST